jgi:aminopeptidase N
LRIDVARALGEIGDARSRGPLRERLEVDLDARVRRRVREVLRDLGHDTKKLNEQMKDDLEKLQNEQAALRVRMAQLEARLTGDKPEAKAEPKGEKSEKSEKSEKKASAVKASAEKEAPRAARSPKRKRKP